MDIAVCQPQKQALPYDAIGDREKAMQLMVAVGACHQHVIGNLDHERFLSAVMKSTKISSRQAGLKSPLR